jgi:putative hemolysin
VPAGLAPFVEGGFRLRFARDAADLEALQRLRFEVFNRELAEGLAESWTTGLDRDPIDATCHHLMLCARSGAVVGTYRMQTLEQANAGAGLYCDGEFDLAPLRARVEHGVELGRACIVREHREGNALFALWRGLAAYLAWSRKRWLFGCCSLTSRVPAEGRALWRLLDAQGHVDHEHQAPVRAAYACESSEVVGAPKVPRLFRTYLRHGGKVCSGPALDHAFGTIDYLMVLDARAVPPKLWHLFFGGLLPSPQQVGT